jgi:hypothetical protein
MLCKLKGLSDKILQGFFPIKAIPSIFAHLSSYVIIIFLCFSTLSEKIDFLTHYLQLNDIKKRYNHRCNDL